MNCDEFKKVKGRFLEGKLSPVEEKAIEAHLEVCPYCREVVDKILNTEQPKLNLSTSDDGTYRLDEAQQKKILRRAKYKNRFNIALFLLVLFILLNIGGGILSSLYFNWGGEAGRLYKAQKTAALITEFTFPNVTVPARFEPFPLLVSGVGWGHSSLRIKPYFMANGNYAMQKRVGKDEFVIGDLDIKQFFSSMNVNWQWRENSFKDYLYFYHPDQLNDPATNDIRPHIADSSDQVWEALGILPEGTVAELSLSLTETFSIDEVKRLFADYDVDITWYAVSTGIEVNPHYNPDRQAPLSASHGVWGVPDFSRHMLRSNSTISDDHSVNESDDHSVNEEYLLESMEFLIQNEAVARKTYRGHHENLQLAQRYDYIKTHGIEVYGVVVTGPTKELLKLKDLDLVQFPGLGEVRLWNWFSRNFQGEMY
ncbi:MAG: anti sigma factor C-terminal domain-containing protein [Syntrophomonadaceae bacterium]|jgi:hypothetical protein